MLYENDLRITKGIDDLRITKEIDDLRKWKREIRRENLEKEIRFNKSINPKKMGELIIVLGNY